VASATTTPPTQKSATTSVSGATPGLYGGTLNLAVCDSEQMVSFLQQNPDKERAWAAVEGIAPSDVPSYIRGLTSVILRVDTRVTNHGFFNGRATTHASVLQAGTAVLVDSYGVPRARCYCGNPLTPPQPLSSPTYTGPSWPGFTPTTVIVVQQTVIVDTFTLIDVTTGDPFKHKPGNDFTNDQPAPSTWNISVKATAKNLQGSTDSTTTVQWTGSFQATNVISGTGTGTGTFNGGCFDLSSGSRVGDWNQTESFNVDIRGDTSTSGGNRTFALSPSASGFANTQVTITGSGSVADSCRSKAADASSFGPFLADAFKTIEIPAHDGDTTVTSGAFSVTVTLTKVA
jgi:hypothetical protein